MTTALILGAVVLLGYSSSFVLPLAFSPLVSTVITLLLYPLFKFARRKSGVTSQTCLCVGRSFDEVVVQAGGTLALRSSGVVLERGQVSDCVDRYRGQLFGVDASAALDTLHYLSAGAVGFARGLNDTPKIVALLIGAQAIAPNAGLALVAVVMAIGGVLKARRVADTLSRKITRMNPGQGFTANLVTSLLVTTASRFGLPVSTTHVSVGSLFGIGLVNGTANRRVVVAILLAWVTTLPIAALLGAVSYWLMAQVT